MFFSYTDSYELDNGERHFYSLCAHPATICKDGKGEVRGQNGLGIYEWNALPSGHYLYAFTYDGHPYTSPSWTSEFIAEEAFFWSTEQSKRGALGYGVKPYMEHALEILNSDNSLSLEEIYSDPLYVDPVSYPTTWGIKSSGDKRSARSLRCVQD